MVGGRESENSGALIGGIIAALAVLISIAFLLILLWRRSRLKGNEVDMPYDAETEFREEAIDGADFGSDEIDIGTFGNPGTAEGDNSFGSAAFSDEREEGGLFLRF
jgi:hypothetical protein